LIAAPAHVGAVAALRLRVLVELRWWRLGGCGSMNNINVYTASKYITAELVPYTARANYLFTSLFGPLRFS
jgi:hypothetical protein